MKNDSTNLTKPSQSKNVHWAHKNHSVNSYRVKFEE